uniref:Eva-1 homolog A, regulator of programmed cell death n=1 Tax=Gallus gallus TaxID=9031 RepID=A0A8V0XUI3_CHICK
GTECHSALLAQELPCWRPWEPSAGDEELSGAGLRGEVSKREARAALQTGNRRRNHRGRAEVPRKLLHETQPRPINYQGFQKPHFPLRPRVFDPNVIGDGVFLSDVSPPSVGRVLPENPERAALYFVSGVCIGLVLTLLALVLRVSCRTDCKRSSTKKPPRESDSDSSDSDADSDTTSDVSARRHRRFERTLNTNVFTSAEELERAQRLEERERIIREIWMNGQPDIPGTRSLNRYY